MKNKNLDLFLTFAKIGAFTFGGGYAMISLFEKEAVEKKNWITEEEMGNIIVIAESTPGPISINAATYIGYKTNKFWGSIFATLGLMVPPVVIITLIAMFLQNILEIEIISNAFRGIQSAVAILILSAALKLFKKMKKSSFYFIVLFITLIISVLSELFFKDFSSIYIILLGGIVGIIKYFITKKPVETEEEGEQNV